MGKIVFLLIFTTAWVLFAIGMWIYVAISGPKQKEIMDKKEKRYESVNITPVLISFKEIVDEAVSIVSDPYGFDEDSMDRLQDFVQSIANLKGKF